MPLKFKALPTSDVRRIQAGGPDANGQAARRKISDGHGNPCRHCLTEIAEGKEMLVLAYRPFPAPQPYAEIGPIFLCAEECSRHEDSSAPAQMFGNYGRVLLRGYTCEHQILYRTGQIVEVADLEKAAERILENVEVSYIHMRSASNNCYQCRIERA